MLTFLCSLFHRRRYGPGHPIFDSKQLVTEAELRQWKSRKVIADVERSRHQSTGNPVEAMILGFPPTEERSSWDR